MSVPKRVNPSPAAVSFKGFLKSGKFMHYYKFNIADYRKDTGHLSTIEHGIYRQLIDWYYLDEQPIPEETQVVIRRLRLGSDEVKFLQNILSDFFVLGKTGYKHKRIEVEIKDYQEQAEKNKNNGKLGGRPKKTQSVISGLPYESQNNPNQEPITTNHKPKRESATSVACPPDVSQQIWGDWVALRKSKKAPITQTVLNGAIAEAKILGWPLEKFLAEWCSRGSQGLKAEWIVKPNPADNIRLTVASSNEPDPALLKIAEDAKKAAPIPLEVLAKMAELRKKA
jgi:uncharacterized protein YdaU (DUF1376 family)